MGCVSNAPKTQLHLRSTINVPAAALSANTGFGKLIQPADVFRATKMLTKVEG